MKHESLVKQIKEKKNFLCVGLDPEQEKLPLHLHRDQNGILTFCKEIIDQTKDLSIAYKLNIAFFECHGAKGWDMLEEIIAYIPTDILKIADAKRGDIGNTSKMYAKTFFQTYQFDAITVAPYMGEDSIRPFLEFDDKWVILLGLTSNSGSKDFQYLKSDGKHVFEHVISKAMTWANQEKLMFVVGATHPENMVNIRNICPNHFLLVPGIGAQGGDLQAVINGGSNDDGGLLINSSRSIIYASNGPDFGLKAREEANKLVAQMQIHFHS